MGIINAKFDGVKFEELIPSDPANWPALFESIAFEYRRFWAQYEADSIPSGCGAATNDNDESEPCTPLEIALFYAPQGIKVFPCNPEDKRPLVSRDRDATGKPIDGTGWKKKATCDLTTIRAWWAKFPRTMIGAATGESSGFWAIDPDVPKLKEGDGGTSPDGVAAWAELIAWHGEPQATFEVSMPSGGRHIYFRFDPDHPVSNDEGDFAALSINVRGTGGYVVLPPSQRAYGKAYVANRTFDLGAIAPAPTWLYAAIGSGRKAPAQEKASIEFPDDLPKVDVASL